ncbi:MAG: serine--tRNA ligase, partial [Alphaproteobacteria bacterium]|nr:serine--tRNA ligase [Alphaproteobacteria bacterium]
MHDIRFIRDNPELFDAAMARRNIDPVAQEILSLDTERRHIQTELQTQQSRRNDASKEIGKVKGSGGNADVLMAEVAELKQSIPALEAEEARLEQALTSHLMGLPNILEDYVPEGADEADNELLRVVGTLPSFSFTPRDHVALGEALGQMDFASAAKLSGARFVVLHGQLARLERALASFMLDIHTTEFGYRETVPPVLVRTQTMTGTGQLPKFEEDLFRTTDDRWLIPTAEV